jgi:phosphopantothenoylcysteine synthetase/decarboxylase
MLYGKNVLVTAGGTQEYIDDVRVMTNTSTGATGARIAEVLCDFGASVYFVHGIHSKKPNRQVPCYPVVTAAYAMRSMESLVRSYDIDAVVHCMAVSDFTFKRDKAIKCKSSDPEAFIDFMRETIAPNPKIISHVKQWNPNLLLVGFKYEVGLSSRELRELALSSIEKNGCDLVIANDKKEIEKAGAHVASFIYSDAMKDRQGFVDDSVIGNDEIATRLVHFLDKTLSNGKES